MAPDASQCFLLFRALSIKLSVVLLLPFAQDSGCSQNNAATYRGLGIFGKLFGAIGIILFSPTSTGCGASPNMVSDGNGGCEPMISDDTASGMLLLTQPTLHT